MYRKTYRNWGYVILLITMCVIPLTSQFYVHRRPQTDILDDYFQFSKRNPKIQSIPSIPSKPKPRMPAACEDPDVWNLCYACGRDINSQAVFRNCCQRDPQTVQYCLYWLEQI